MSKVTGALLKKIFPGTPQAKLNRFVVPFNTILPKYQINNKKRFSAFIANVGIESDRLKAVREYASGKAYEGRTNLGNVRDGDGVRFAGRSVLQNTGRYNYWKVVVAYIRVKTGKNWSSDEKKYKNFEAYIESKDYDNLLKEADLLNVNFLAHPELLEEFPHAVEAACIFVEDNKLNVYADKGTQKGFTEYANKLNTGSTTITANHLSLRKELYKLANEVIPDDFELTEVKDKPTILSEPPVEEIVVTPDLTTELTKTETTKEDGTTTETSVQVKNEQNVNIPTEVQGRKPYQGIGFLAVIKRDLAALGAGNFSFEGLSTYFQQASGWPTWIVAILTKLALIVLVLSIAYLVFRLVHYSWYVWSENHRIKLESQNNADPTKKNLTITEVK